MSIRNLPPGSLAETSEDRGCPLASSATPPQPPCSSYAWKTQRPFRRRTPKQHPLQTLRQRSCALMNGSINWILRIKLPVIDGGHLLKDALSIDVPITRQPSACLQHTVDLLLIGIHRGHEVFLLLDCSLSALQRGWHLCMSQNILLQRGSELL